MAADSENPEQIRKALVDLLTNFQEELASDDLRRKVLSLVPCYSALRNLGKSLIPPNVAENARDRILHYFLKYPQQVIQGNELLVVSGIQEYARRVRELKVQFGWAIVSGVTAKQMAAETEFDHAWLDFSSVAPSDYILLSVEQDREAAHRWNLANEIRKKDMSVRNKLLKYFRANIGQSITGEELQYVANGKTEWARRIRELRTEQGWPIVSKNTGRPDLDIGVYVLEADRQSPQHDRSIPDAIKRAVLRRDSHRCSVCGWSHDEWNRSDPRHLELHHVKPHVKGGENSESNLITVCTVCHDEIHRRSPKNVG